MEKIEERCSLDARSEGTPGHSLEEKFRALKGAGSMAAPRPTWLSFLKREAPRFIVPR